MMRGGGGGEADGDGVYMYAEHQQWLCGSVIMFQAVMATAISAVMEPFEMTGNARDGSNSIWPLDLSLSLWPLVHL